MFDPYSKVDDFINNKLAEKELTAFKDVLATDSELRTVVENHRIYSAIAEGVIDYNISKTIVSVQNKAKIRTRTIVAVLFFVFLVSMVTVFILSANGKKKYRSELYAEYYSPPMGNINRGVYNVDSLSEFCDRGHWQLDKGLLSKAKVSFLSSISSEEGVCKEKSLFYLSLIAIIEDEPKSKIISYLNEIQEGETTGYEVKAKALVDKLDSF